MAYFNPNRVDFNYNTNMIDAVGAVGRSLWDIYKDNVVKNQNQMKIEEDIRSNKATEFLTGQKNLETARHNLVDEKIKGVNADTSIKELEAKRQYWANQANHWANSDKVAAMNANTSRINANTATQRLNFDKTKYLQDSADDILKVNLGFKELGLELPENIANLSPEEQHQYKKAMLSIKTPNGNVYGALKAQKESNDTDPLKNLPVGIKSKLDDTMAILDVGLDAGNTILKNKTGSTTGGWDAPIGKFFSWLGFPSAVNADKTAAAEAYADITRQKTKGGGKVGYDIAKEQFDPYRISHDVLEANISRGLSTHLRSLENQIDTLREQGNYKAAEYLQAKFNDYVNDYTYITNRPYSAKIETDEIKKEQITNAFKEKKLIRQNQQDYYEQADEHGGIYLN